MIRDASLVLIAVLIVALSVPLFVHAASTNAQGPTVLVSDGSIGSTPWVTPANAGASDNMNAMAALLLNQQSQYLKVTGFGFAIPSTAVIEGIQVVMDRSAILFQVTDAAVRVVRSNVVGTMDRSSGEIWPTSKTSVIYGGSVDLWGAGWTPAEINAPDFGFAISAHAQIGVTANIDHISIRIFYNSAPVVASFSASPDPVAAGSDVTFTAQVTDAEGNQVKALFCRTNSVTPTSSGGSCPGGAWATTDLTSASARSAVYSTQAGDAPVITYFAFACDDHSTCSPATGNTSSVTVQTETTGGGGGNGGGSGGGVTVPVNVSVNTPAPQPAPSPSIASTSSSPTSISISISGLGGAQTSAPIFATTSDESMGMAKILNSETQIAPGSSLNLLFQTEQGLTGDKRPTFSLYDPDFGKRITNQSMSETSAGVYTSRVVFDPAWGTGTFVFIATGYPTSAKDAYSIRIQKISPPATPVSANVTSSGSSGNCAIDELVGEAKALRTMPQIDLAVKIESLQTLARGVATCARASGKSPALSDYAVEQETKAHALEAIFNEPIKASSARNVTEIIGAAASTTKALLGGKNKKRPIIEMFWTAGSVVMNILITNPADSLETSVDIRAPLPEGVTPKLVFKKPEGLRMEYDPTIQRYILVGTVSILRGASVNLELEFEDIWSIPEEELQAREHESQTLYQKLVGSNFAPEALRLRDEILELISDVRSKQNVALSPDEKLSVQGHDRETITTADDKLKELEELVAKSERAFELWIAFGAGILLLFLISFLLLWRRFGSALDTISRKGESISFASHQLRNLLTAGQWSLEKLQSIGGTFSDKQKKYLETAYKTNVQTSQLVKDILTASKLESGTTQPEQKTVNVSELARSVLEELAPLITQKHLLIKEHLDKNAIAIQSDPALVRIIFQNLISNAAKYTPEGGTIGLNLARGTGKVLFGKRPSNRAAVIQVSDTGYGIPQAQQARIFTKSFRADNARELDKDGTGLGLYIVKKIIDRLGGDVWFYSEENKGTTFCVTLPLGAAEKEST